MTLGERIDLNTMLDKPKPVTHDDLVNASVKRPNGNFQFLARVERSAEYPTMRQDIQQLEMDWSIAMEVISSTEGAAVNPSNPLESDLNGLQGAVDREYQSRYALWAVVETTKHFEVRLDHHR